VKRRLDEVQMSEQEQILDGVVSVREIFPYLAEDRYFTLTEASEYSRISGRTLRDRDDLPRYRPSSKLLLFKKSELDTWLSQFREGGKDELDELVNETLANVLGD